MKNIIISILSLFTVHANAQTDSAKKILNISAYIETYYSYDFAKPSNHNRQNFVYAFNKHNEVNLNLGFVKVGFVAKNQRANLALMTGTYANTNLASEPGVLKNILEANAGVKISKNQNLWVDAGIFTSHIGFESAIGKDCWTLTRSILADNSPYFESGVKLTYTSDNEKWLISGLILNGWQRIQRVDGNNTPSFGHQLTFKPNSKITINSSSFVGSDTPDSAKKMRYFHNFFTQIQLNKKFGLVAGFDLGAQQKSKGNSSYNYWYSPVIIAKYSATAKIDIALRGESYNDANGVIISTGTTQGFETYGYSLNIDYNIADNVKLRMEGRGFTSKDKIFNFDNQPSTQNYFLTTSLAISF